MPYFTIVMPTYDRPALLERALRTCVAQDFTDWEAIVVDDASPSANETSADVVRRIGDPRISLIRHERNQGVCAARDTASRAARGTWLIFHDDDDELLPGALAHIHQTAERARPEIRRLIFAYRDDDGLSSPEPPLVSGTVWQYSDYMQWLDQVSERTDFLNCIHREVFQHVSWPSDRSREDIFHLDLARRFNTECHNDVVAVIHTDAVNRFTAVPGPERLLRMAPDIARQVDRIVSGHGDALSRWAPEMFSRYLRQGAINHFLAGNRTEGVRYSVRFIRQRPIALSGWASLLLGLLSRRLLASVVATSKRQRARRARSRSGIQ